MNTLLDAENSFYKIQHPFMIKVLKWPGIQGTYLNIIKAIYSQHPVKYRETQSIPLKSGTRQSFLLFHTYRDVFFFFQLLLFKFVLGVLPKVIKQDEEMTDIKTGKE